MCGITGLTVSEPRQLDPGSIVERMQSSLVHRGPDDRGLFVASNYRCALAHTRLSILDLSAAGHQPMGLIEPEVGGQKSEVRHGRTARYWIVFNGEIYNYRELREELGAKSKERGVEFVGQYSLAAGTRPTLTEDTWQSNSDTEVILKAYAKWGRDCVQHFRGMFAFAIWDEQRQELFLARDPFGIKPLYFYQTGSLLLFASEVRALLASDLVPRRLSQDGLVSYLQYGSVQDPVTMVEGVKALLPGGCLTVNFRENNLHIESSNYAENLSQRIGTTAMSTRSEGVVCLRAELEEAVRLHLVSDVPLGAFLSGGIDSSAIVALMSQVTDKAPKTFSVVFEEADFSEGEHAKAVARKFGTEHHEILLSEQSLLKMLPGALEAMDQPTMDGINTYVISKAVKESGVTVALSGLGGDELFAGYPSFRRAKQLQLIGMAPFGLRKLASAVAGGFSNGSVRQRKFWDLVESDCSPTAAYAISRQLFSPADIVNLTARDQMSEACPEQSRRVRGQCPDVGKSEIRNSQSEIGVPPDVDVINAVSMHELRGYMANTLLRDTDQMSMVHSLEVRVPFIDPVVVQYVLSLPGSWKVDGERSKPLLVDALGNLLPKEVWQRPKMGFTLPFERWMRSSLQGEVDDVLSSGNGLADIGMNDDFGRGVWRAFRDNPRHEAWSRPWALFVLKRWCDLNDVHL